MKYIERYIKLPTSHWKADVQLLQGKQGNRVLTLSWEDSSLQMFTSSSFFSSAFIAGNDTTWYEISILSISIIWLGCDQAALPASSLTRQCEKQKNP